MKGSVYMGSLGIYPHDPLKCSQNPYRVENIFMVIYSLISLSGGCFLTFIICLFLKKEGGKRVNLNVYMDSLAFVKGVRA